MAHGGSFEAKRLQAEFNRERRRHQQDRQLDDFRAVPDDATGARIGRIIDCLVAAYKDEFEPRQPTRLGVTVISSQQLAVARRRGTSLQSDTFAKVRDAVIEAANLRDVVALQAGELMLKDATGDRRAVLMLKDADGELAAERAKLTGVIQRQTGWRAAWVHPPAQVVIGTIESALDVDRTLTQINEVVRGMPMTFIMPTPQAPGGVPSGS